MSGEINRWNSWLSSEVQSNQTKTNPTPIFEVIGISNRLFQNTNNPSNTKQTQSLTKQYIIKYIDTINDPKIKQVLYSLASADFNLNYAFGMTNINVISAEMANKLDNQLRVAESVFRSSGGVNGVYFLQLPDNQRTPHAMILKLPPDDATQHIIADRFFRCFGFVTPQYSAVHHDTSLGILAYNTLNRLGNEYYELEGKANPLPKLLKRPYMTVMEMIPGIPLSNLSIDDSRALLRDPSILHSIGEILFLDGCIGNRDRFYQNNLGNCILLGDNKTDTFGRRLALIDHDYLLTDTRKEEIFDVFKSIVETDIIVGAVVSALIMNYGDQEANKMEMATHIRAGIVDMRAQFLKTFSNENTIMSLFDFPNTPSLGKPKQQNFMEMIALCQQTQVYQ